MLWAKHFTTFSLVICFPHYLHFRWIISKMFLICLPIFLSSADLQVTHFLSLSFWNDSWQTYKFGWSSSHEYIFLPSIRFYIRHHSDKHIAHSKDENPFIKSLPIWFWSYSFLFFSSSFFISIYFFCSSSWFFCSSSWNFFLYSIISSSSNFFSCSFSFLILYSSIFFCFLSVTDIYLFF